MHYCLQDLWASALLYCNNARSGSSGAIQGRQGFPADPSYTPFKHTQISRPKCSLRHPVHASVCLGNERLDGRVRRHTAARCTWDESSRRRTWQSWNLHRPGALYGTCLLPFSPHFRFCRALHLHKPHLHFHCITLMIKNATHGALDVLNLRVSESFLPSPSVVSSVHSTDLSQDGSYISNNTTAVLHLPQHCRRRTALY